MKRIQREITPKHLNFGTGGTHSGVQSWAGGTRLDDLEAGTNLQPEAVNHSEAMRSCRWVASRSQFLAETATS
jgi:hypothetical protein